MTGVAMGFLAPMMLFGGAAVSVPLALHFFYKARYRPMPWAAMTFLKQSIEQTSRRLKFQELILLMLRCLCLLLLALAIARPSCSAVSSGGRGESIDAIIVFDISYSMGASDGEESRFDRAKKAAITVIENLPSNSTVQIITFTDRGTHVGPVTPGNLDQAKNLVQSLELSSQSSDVLAGLNEAYSALDRTAGSNKEVYLFTDLQKTSWDRQAGAIKAKAAEIKDRATLVLVRCGNPDRPTNNVSLVDLSFPGGIPQRGTRLPVTLLLRNTGKEPVKDLTVSLEVDNNKNLTESASVPEVKPGYTHPVTLTAKPEAAGPVLLSATISRRDDVPGDDRLDRIISVRDRVRVLVVDGKPPSRDPKDSASHFLVNALLPVTEKQRAGYIVQVTTVTPQDANPGMLGIADICFLCDVPVANPARPGSAGLSKEFCDRLAKFVNDGGGLVIGAGDNVNIDIYNAVFGSVGSKLLPFDLAPVEETTPQAPFKPAPETTESPGFLDRFREEPFRTVTADADVFKVMGIKDADRPPGRVVMRLTNGKPWWTARVVGQGEVVFLGSTLDTTWTNWPAKAGSYLSFVQYTLSHLTGKGTRGTNLVAGKPIVYHPLEASRGFDVVRPDGKRVRLGKAQTDEANGKLTVTYSDTSIAGIYRVGPEGQDPPAGPRFAVVPDLSEADNLDSLGDAEVEQVVGFKPVLVLAGPNSSDELISERNRREWTIWILILLFGVAIAETAWAWVCGRAW